VVGQPGFGAVTTHLPSRDLANVLSWCNSLKSIQITRWWSGAANSARLFCRFPIDVRVAMSPETLRYAVIMLMAGIGIPLMAALNTQLGNRIGSPAAAATVLFTVAVVAAGIVMLLTSGPAPLRLIPAQPIYLPAAGLFVVFYVLSVTWIAPRFGIGNAIFCVLLGQMISATVIDHFGLFGAVVKPLSLVRASGIGFMVMGVLLIQKS
jgi:bacterial/archaeal transporter family-2 protein